MKTPPDLFNDMSQEPLLYELIRDLVSGKDRGMMKKCDAYQTRKFRKKKGNHFDKGAYLLLSACRWAGGMV